MNKNGEMFLFVGFGVFPPTITRAVCLNMFYFGVNGARLIFCQMSLTYTYKRPDQLPNSNSQECQDIFLPLSGKLCLSCPVLTSASSFHIKTPEEPCNVKAVSNVHI